MADRRQTLPPVAVDVVQRGPVPDGDADYARSKVDHVIGYANQPVLAAHVVLTMAQDPAMERPARAEAPGRAGPGRRRAARRSASTCGPSPVAASWPWSWAWAQRGLRTCSTRRSRRTG